MAKKAVFIDRDGTIAKDAHYCSRPEDLALFDGVAQSIKKLNDAGFLVIMITNQSGIGRGYFSSEIVEEIHEKMKKDLAEEGAYIDAIYYCPHHPEEGCNCRKPETQLVEQALEDFDISLKDSFVIGDRWHDTELGRRIGCTSIQVNHSHSEVPSFNEAVNMILET